MGFGAISVIALLLVIPSVSPLVPSPSVVKVKFGDSATLPCDGSAYAGFSEDQLDVLWQTVDNVKVAHYYRGGHRAGSLFSNRVTFLPERLWLGDFSLTIRSVGFSDLDTYECVWNKGPNQKVLNDVRLYVLKPSVPECLSVPVGDSVTLPCFDSTKKQAADELSVQWKRGEELVLNLSSGVVAYSPMYERRASVSPKRIKKGDFSLSLNVTGLCDSGVYHCSVDQNKDVTSVTLNLTDHGHFIPVDLALGMPLPFSLPGEPVKVNFSKEGTLPEVTLCSVDTDWFKCEPEYKNRMERKSDTLTMLNVTLDDVGTYTVIYTKNCVISHVYRVNVKHSDTSDQRYLLFLFIFIIFIPVPFLVWKYKEKILCKTSLYVEIAPEKTHNSEDVQLNQSQDSVESVD